MYPGKQPDWLRWRGLPLLRLKISISLRALKRLNQDITLHHALRNQRLPGQATCLSEVSRVLADQAYFLIGR